MIQVPRKLMAALAACLAFVAASVFMWTTAVDPAPAISVVSIFLHGQRYPDDPHHLKLRLKSGGAEVFAETSLPVFSEFKPSPDFALPVNGDLLFSITEGSRRLIRLSVTKSGETLNVTHSCRVPPDVATAYPYKGFASYIPPGSLLLMCSTDIGVIEIRLGCWSHGTSSLCGLHWNSQTPAHDHVNSLSR